MEDRKGRQLLDDRAEQCSSVQAKPVADPECPIASDSWSVILDRVRNRIRTHTITLLTYLATVFGRGCGFWRLG